MNAHTTEVRSRTLTNARTATRSLDLPLAIAAPRVCPSAGPILCPSVEPGQCAAATAAAFFCTLIEGPSVARLDGRATRVLSA
jgi:hypothetical protein